MGVQKEHLNSYFDSNGCIRLDSVKDNLVLLASLFLSGIKHWLYLLKMCWDINLSR